MDSQKQSDCLCMRSGCTNLYKFMLRSKNKAFCSTCTATFYFDTNIGHPAGTTIREKSEIVDILQVLDETLKIMKEDGELLGLQEFYYDYFSDLRDFEAKSASLYKRTSFCDFKTDFDEGLNLFETAFRTLCAVRVSQMAVTRNNYKLSLELSQRVTGQKTEVKSTDQSFESRVYIAAERIKNFFQNRFESEVNQMTAEVQAKAKLQIEETKKEFDLKKFAIEIEK